MIIAKVAAHWRALFGPPKRKRPRGWKRPREFVLLVGGEADGKVLTVHANVRSIKIPIPVAYDLTPLNYSVLVEINYAEYVHKDRCRGPLRIYEYERK